jgi:hypothetical protein
MSKCQTPVRSSLTTKLAPNQKVKHQIAKKRTYKPKLHFQVDFQDLEYHQSNYPSEYQICRYCQEEIDLVKAHGLCFRCYNEMVQSTTLSKDVNDWRCYECDDLAEPIGYMRGICINDRVTYLYDTFVRNEQLKAWRNIGYEMEQFQPMCQACLLKMMKEKKAHVSMLQYCPVDFCFYTDVCDICEDVCKTEEEPPALERLWKK